MIEVIAKNGNYEVEKQTSETTNKTTYKLLHVSEFDGFVTLCREYKTEKAALKALNNI
jgi:hypothetical protein